MRTPPLARIQRSVARGRRVALTRTAGHLEELKKRIDRPWWLDGDPRDSDNGQVFERMIRGKLARVDRMLAESWADSSDARKVTPCIVVDSLAEITLDVGSIQPKTRSSETNPLQRFDASRTSVLTP